MSFSRIKSVVCGLFAVGSIGCAATDGATEDPGSETSGSKTVTAQTGASDLTLAEASTTALAGTFHADNGLAVHFAVRAMGDEVFALDVTVGEKTLEAQADLKSQSLYANGHDVQLNVGERYALLAASRGLWDELGGDASEASFSELFVMQNLGYWSEVPEGHAIGERVFAPREKGTGNDGISCVKKNQWYTAYYDNRAGVVSQYGIMVGSNFGASACGGGDYSCMGRCGAACGWGAPSSWTRDCLEHDACSHDLCASGGGGDANCGDEYNEAQDDWTFGVLAGCSG